MQTIFYKCKTSCIKKHKLGSRIISYRRRNCDLDKNVNQSLVTDLSQILFDFRAQL